MLDYINSMNGIAVAVILCVVFPCALIVFGCFCRNRLYNLAATAICFVAMLGMAAYCIIKAALD